MPLGLHDSTSKMKAEVLTMRTSLIRVTKDLIRKGGYSGLNCPVALAIHEQGPLIFAYAHVSKEGLVRGAEGDYRRYPLPKKVTEFIVRYDAGIYRKSLKPFSFYLNG